MSKHPQSPPPDQRVTLRDIAKTLGISHVTVSKALRGLSGVSDKLQTRIKEQADQMGYVPDPLLASLSSYRRTSKSLPIQSELAWLTPWEDSKGFFKHEEFRLYFQGATDTAKQLGYRIQEYPIHEYPLKRLETIFQTRNIQGLLLPPIYRTIKDLQKFNWSQFAIVRFGRTTQAPFTHFVSSSQFSNTMLALDMIRQLGYQRTGYVGEYWRNRFFGAAYHWSMKAHDSTQKLPPLILDPTHSFQQQQDSFQLWLESQKPDSLLTDNSETHSMLKNLGYRIPDDIALATTSIHDTSIDTGIDQRPYEIGCASIRMLTSLIASKSFGIPHARNETLIEGSWVNGSMLPNKK